MEGEVLEFDALFVGAGPAGLAGAIHLSDLIDSHNRAVAAGAPGKPLGEMTIAVLEKSSTVGAHGISGAVLDPRAMRELLPDFIERGCPAETQAARPIVEDGRVLGVRTGDKGVNKQRQRKPNYQPGADCRARVTVLSEGPRGTIAKALEKQLGLTAGRNAQVYSTGVKELWEMPAGRVEKGRVIHTLGFPLPHDTFGGSFIYGMTDTHWSVGFVTGLDSRDPTTDPHGNLQRFKTHPFV